MRQRFQRESINPRQGDSENLTYDANGRHSYATECRNGRQCNGGINSDSGSAYGSNVGRAAEILRGGEYGVVHADSGRENVGAGSDNAGVFKTKLKWQADIGGE